MFEIDCGFYQRSILNDGVSPTEAAGVGCRLRHAGAAEDANLPFDVASCAVWMMDGGRSGMPDWFKQRSVKRSRREKQSESSEEWNGGSGVLLGMEGPGSSSEWNEGSGVLPGIIINLLPSHSGAYFVTVFLLNLSFITYHSCTICP